VACSDILVTLAAFWPRLLLAGHRLFFLLAFVIYMRVRCMWKNPAEKEKRERTRPAATCCGQPHTSTGREKWWKKNVKKGRRAGESYLLQIG